MLGKHMRLLYPELAFEIARRNLRKRADTQQAVSTALAYYPGFKPCEKLFPFRPYGIHGWP